MKINRKDISSSRIPGKKNSFIESKKLMSQKQSFRLISKNGLGFLNEQEKQTSNPKYEKCRLSKNLLFLSRNDLTN